VQHFFLAAVASKSGFGAAIADAVAGSSIEFCNSFFADRIVAAASRLLGAATACEISLVSHTEPFTRRRFYKQRSFYTRQAFTHKIFYTQQAFHHKRNCSSSTGSRRQCNKTTILKHFSKRNFTRKIASAKIEKIC